MSSDDQRPDVGTAGASARREHARRAARRETEIREKHPLLGSAILALTDEPAHQRSWERGAVGEERVGESLRRHVAKDVVLLHDRRLPGSNANIDHIAVSTSGVRVIDAKRYRGKVEVRKPLFGQPKLLIAGRDRSKLADGLARQVQHVKSLLIDTAPEVPVHGALAFVDADLPILGRLSFSGYPLVYPRQLAKRVPNLAQCPPSVSPTSPDNSPLPSQARDHAVGATIGKPRLARRQRDRLAGAATTEKEIASGRVSV